MSQVPTDLKYTESHEWVRLDSDGVVTVGITDHAQALLGDLVYVELPEVGQTVDDGAESGVVESVKAASDLYAPLSGEVVEINEALQDAPELVNQDPYHDGWIFKLSIDNDSQLDGLLDADQYGQHVAD